MNIGIVTTWFERGAAYVSKLFQQSLEQDNQVFIYARGGESYAKGDPKWDTHEVTWGKKIRTPFVSTVIHKGDFIKWLKNNDIEIVIFNEQHWFQPILWCKELGIKTLAYIDYYTERSIPLFDIYDGLICNTKRHLSAFNKHHNVYYVPWGTDIDLFKPYEENVSSLVNPKCVTFFHSAGMTGERKGTDIFINALYEIRDEEFKAIIHTQKDLKCQFPYLSEVIDNLADINKLEIINKTIPAPGLYYKGDVYIYPSRLEGIGLTIAEAIASGLACVVPNNAPMSEFVSPEIGKLISIERLYARSDGYYWPKCTPSINSLAEILKYYISNPALVIEQKKKAREYATAHLNSKNNFFILNDIVSKINFTPATQEIIDKVNAFDYWGFKRFVPYFIKFRLYKLLK